MYIKNGIVEGVRHEGIIFLVATIPIGRKRRPRIRMVPNYITIHNTGCEGVPADNFRRVQLDESQDTEVSWHFTIDEKNIIQHLPITEVAWHAGNQEGNYHSIGIEICERQCAEEVAIWFIGELLKILNLEVSCVRTHKSWSGKLCPRKLLPHWEQFLQNIRESKKDVILEEAVHQLVITGIIGNPSTWNAVERMNLKNTPSLLYKMGGIGHLVEEGIIKNKYLWESKAYSAEHVRSLLIKYGDFLKHK